MYTVKSSNKNEWWFEIVFAPIYIIIWRRLILVDVGVEIHYFNNNHFGDLISK